MQELVFYTWTCSQHQEVLDGLAVREILESSRTFCATNISNYITWLIQLHYTIQIKIKLYMNQL